MKIARKYTTVIIISFLLLLSCDEKNNPTVKIISQQSALTDPNNEATEIPNNDEIAKESNVPKSSDYSFNDFVFSGDDPDSIIDIKWADREAADKDLIQTDSLGLIVSNRMNLPTVITVSVYFSGILEKTAEIELGPFDIAPKEELFLEISDSDLPIQTTQGVCQATASVIAEYEDRDGQWYKRISTDGIFYRNNPGYKGLSIFGSQIFISQFGGQFLDIARSFSQSGLEAMSEVSFGRIKKSNGVFEDVKISSLFKDNAVMLGSTIGYGDDLQTEVNYVK